VPTANRRAGRRTKPREAKNSRQALDRLLALRNEHPERLAEIDRQIRELFAETHAVMVLDMCGFSRLTMRHGITHFLAMIQRLHAIVVPVVRDWAGTVVKTEADNVFAIFPEVAAAVDAACDIQRRLRAANAVLPKDWDLNASLGIGYGELLIVDGNDLYGSEINIASKLGEDVAASGEIFLTQAAHARLARGARADTAADARSPARRFEPRQIPISAMVVTAYKLRDGP
jgi:adenylate cyclase